MSIVVYERKPLTLLSMVDSSLEEAVEFLNKYGKRKYESVGQERLDSNTVIFRVRPLLDKSTVISLTDSTVLIYNPDRDEVSFAHNLFSLKSYGVNKDILNQLLKVKEPKETCEVIGLEP